MSITINEGMGDLGITITHQQIAEMEKLAIHFVLRKTHPLTFSGQHLGVHPVAFIPSDYNALFDIFRIHKKDVELKIKEIDSIDKNFNVISDPFNVLCIWLCHLAPIYIKDKRVCHNFMANVLRYFHYRIFCSVVNNSFKHGANPAIAEATLLQLTKKSDVIRLGNWNAVIESHIEKILDPNDRFYETIKNGYPDDMFLRVISENQTSLRQKLVTYANTYYEVYKAGDSVGSSSAIAENDEGEKILAQTASVIDSASSAMISELLNVNTFVHDVSINDVAGLFTTISPKMLKLALMRINETAVLQSTSKKFDETKKDKDGIIFIGVRGLVLEIIRSMIRICRVRRINMGNKAQVFEKMKDAYSASRQLDPDILAIKRSVALLVDSFNITVNQASQSALRLGVIYYIIYRTLGRLKH